MPTGSSTSAPTGSLVEARRAGRRACRASPPSTPRSPTAPPPAGRASGGPRRRARTTDSTVAASSGPTGRTSTLTGASTRSAGRGDQLVEGRVDLVVPLHDHHVPGALALEQGRPVDPRVQLAAVADRGELVVGAADDRGRHLGQGVDGLELVERPRSWGRTPPPPRTASTTASRRRTRRSSRARRRRTPARRSPPWRPTGRSGAARRRCGARGPAWRRPATRTVRRAPSGRTGSRIRCTSTLPAVVEIRPTPTTRSPNSSGCCSARAMIVIPPIEWPTSTTGPSGTTSSRTCLRSWPSWSMVALPSAIGRSGRASAGRSRPRAPVRGSRRAGSASSRG